MIFKRRRRAREAASQDDPAEDEGRPAPTEGDEPAPGQGAEGVEPAPAQGAESAEPAPAQGAESAEPAPGQGAEEPEQRAGVIGETRKALAPVKKRHLLVAGLGLMGFSVAAIFVVSAASFWWTSQPSFCNRCHVMKPYVAQWKVSPHRDVNCEACHLTPGLFGFLGGKISGLQVVSNYIRGDYRDWSFNAAVSNASCLRCHEAILESNVHDSKTGITVSHENIIGMGAKCVQCHSTVAHGSAVAVGSQTHPTMATCLTCHNDKIAPLRCDLCHTDRAPPSAIPSAQASPSGAG
jgi:nitrate/TMAO reductase-like tetraheme cytochrome c subunit